MPLTTPGDGPELLYRVCYEDTDAGGVVYHANYLRYLERGRTEYLRRRGFSVKRMMEEGCIFPVIRAELEYRAPALYDDLLTVETRLVARSRTTVTFRQRVRREGEEGVLLEGRITLACVGPGMRPRRLPGELLEGLPLEEE